MICPLSEKRSRGVRLGFGMQPNVYQLRDGADDEDSRSAVTRHGEEDHVVASSRDHRSQRTHDAALAGAAAENCYVIRIATKRLSVLPNQLDCGNLVHISV